MQKSITIRAGPTSAFRLESLTPYLLWTLVIAGLSELVLFRAMSRIGVHIPKTGAVFTVYDALVDAGSFAFDVSSVAVFPAVALLAYALLARVSGARPLPGVIGLLFVAQAASALALSLVQEDAAARFAFGLGSAAVMLLAALHAIGERRSDPLRSLVVAMVVLSFLAAQYQVLANQGYRALDIVASPPGTRAALELGELLVVLNAAVVFWAWSGIRRGRRFRPSALQLAAALALLLLFAGSYYGRHESSAPAILSLWTLGLTLYLPLPVYGVALALYAAACIGRLQEGARRPPAITDGIALALLPVAGLTLELTYQHLVALLALVLLAAGPLLAAEARSEAEAREQPQVV